MKKVKKYRYIGRNGIIISAVLLEDAKHSVVYSISADEGKILTNGEEMHYQATVEEDELASWTEIADNTNK